LFSIGVETWLSQGGWIGERDGFLDNVETIVVGAGVVGLAIARQLAIAGQEVVVLEAQGAIGTQTSSRNSEVIHAGIYYPQDWLKTRLCIEGRAKLYRYCESRGVPHRRLGKLIVAATEAELPLLEQKFIQARANGLGLITHITQQEIQELEPNVTAVAGLHSPETGIVDSHQLMLSLQGDLEEAGGVVSCQSPFDSGKATEKGFEVAIGGEQSYRLNCRRLINSAGLNAQVVAGRFVGLSAEHIPDLGFARGKYYSLQGRSPFKRLVYPVPADGGLGIHVTLDLAGQARFGPDVHWIDGLDYDFDESVIGIVADDIRRYYPELDESRLQAGYTGIRAKLSGPGSSGADFVVSGPTIHGLSGLVNLYGIESPGLTASLALADYVLRLLD
jgi:L-2-hydroxyglutarate oxidase LhgO